jgi:hypothetical protein
LFSELPHARLSWVTPLARLCNPCHFCNNVYLALTVKSYKIEVIGILEILLMALSWNIAVMQM